jgi:Holliday junction resolvase-like predicted endonuclease
VARNYRCRSGEVDAIVRQGRARLSRSGAAGSSHGEGYEVTFGKRLRIVRAARLYAAARPLGIPVAFRRSVDRLDRGQARIRHEPGAFDADGH